MSEQQTPTIQLAIDQAVQQHTAGHLSQAQTLYQQILQRNPDQPVALHLLGVIAHQTGDNDKAVNLITRALELAPNLVEAHNNIGIVLRELGRLNEARVRFANALDLRPDYAEARYNLGMLQLLEGDFVHGWENYAWRHKMDQYNFAKINYRKPTWDGEALKDRTILVHPEQGLGDSIQFVRYVPTIATLAAQVLLEVPTELVRLFQHIKPPIQIIQPNTQIPEFDYQTSLLDLPRLLNTSLETIPTYHPYLQAPPALVNPWKERIGHPNTFRLGIVWAGNPKHRHDRDRSIDARLFRSLIGIPGITVFSLQIGRDGEAAQIFGGKVIDIAPLLCDFADTAAALNNMDLVVTVDTAVAHLAGALGRPTRILLPFVPDWRWLLERNNSPWYPTVQLLRQKQRGDWKTAVDKIRTELTAAGNRPQND